MTNMLVALLLQYHLFNQHFDVSDVNIGLTEFGDVGEGGGASVDKTLTSNIFTKYRCLHKIYILISTRAYLV